MQFQAQLIYYLKDQRKVQVEQKTENPNYVKTKSTFTF